MCVRVQLLRSLNRARCLWGENVAPPRLCAQQVQAARENKVRYPRKFWRQNWISAPYIFPHLIFRTLFFLAADPRFSATSAREARREKFGVFLVFYSKNMRDLWFPHLIFSAPYFFPHLIFLDTDPRIFSRPREPDFRTLFFPHLIFPAPYFRERAVIISPPLQHTSKTEYCVRAQPCRPYNSV